MSISKLVDKLSKVNYSRIMDECFAETEDDLMDLLRSQLAQGKKADGDMPEYKSKAYAMRKGSSRVNLKLTGSFLGALRMIQNKYSVRLRSTDKKAPKLLRMYGPKSLELNPENYSLYVRKFILPRFQKKLKNGLLSKNE